MSDLIDRHLIADMVDAHNNVHWEDIVKLPSAEPERKKGRWIVDTNGLLHCSNCSKIPTNRIVVEGIVIYDMTPIREKMKYCPNCGADMRSNKA